MVSIVKCSCEECRGCLCAFSARPAFLRRWQESGVLDDGVEYAPSPDHVRPAPGFHFEDQAAAVDLHELGEGSHGCSDGHCLEMVHLDAHANVDRPRRQGGPNGVRAGHLHQPNHRWSGKNGRPVWIEMRERPFLGHNSFARSLRGRAQFLPESPGSLQCSPTRRSMGSSRGTAGPS